MIPRPLSAPLVLLAALLAVGCEARHEGVGVDDHVPGAERVLGERKARSAADEQRPLVLFLGDSLTAGYGLAEEEAFPARLAEGLAEVGVAARVVNAGVSGDTTAGGLSRLDWLLRQRPDVVVLALGANDGLRGLAPEQTEENLRRIVERLQGAQVRVLLAGMRLPPNYGPDYIESFESLYPRLAEELEVPLIPFLLEGVAARPELNLADGIHPNAAGQQRVAEHVLPFLLPLLTDA